MSQKLHMQLMCIYIASSLETAFQSDLLLEAVPLAISYCSGREQALARPSGFEAATRVQRGTKNG